VRDIIDASPRAAWFFSRVTALGRFRRDLPIDAWCTAGITAVRHEDCGPCTQLAVTMAERAGVNPAVLRAVRTSCDTCEDIMRERTPLHETATGVSGEKWLAGHGIVVAGGTGNVGRYLVRALLEQSARVIVPSRSAENLEGLRASIGVDHRERLITIVGDLSDETDAVRVQQHLRTHRPLHGAIASLGRFIPAPSVLSAPIADVRAALNDYVIAHFQSARTLIPLIEDNGSYTIINGPLAFDAMFEGTGLVSIVTAAQAMLARVLFKERKDGPVRVNEVVVYTPFGWGDKAPAVGTLPREDVGRYVAHLVSNKGGAVRGQTIHLKSRQAFEVFELVTNSM
jgi:NAD(P)-dependent dehydrogenase (short-subunit alcohol dehydrogenase family)